MSQPTVIAFIGDSFGGRVKPEHLRQDMGDPAWLDLCMAYDRHPGHRYSFSRQDWQVLITATALILLGFSRGGDVVRFLSRYMHDKIRLGIPYEAPCFGPPGGSFKVLLGTNRHSLRTHKPNGRLRPKARNMFAAWDDGRLVVPITGVGRHIKRVDRPETANLGHGWDVALNPRFATEIAKAS